MAGKKVTHSEEWWANAPGHILRCTASYKSNGLQCRREAHPGTNVCGQHGALAPAVLGAAATRIQMSADDVLRRLQAMLDDPAVDARDRIKIMLDWLDRAGLNATNKHVVGVVTEDPIERLFRSVLSSPDGLTDAVAAPPLALPAPDPVQAAIDAAEAGPTWDDPFGRRAEFSDASDVVDAELVEEPAALTTPAAEVPEVVATRPPKHMLEDLERAGLW